MKLKELKKKKIDQGKWFMYVPSKKPMKVTGYGREVNNGKEAWFVSVEIYTGNYADQKTLKYIYNMKDIGKQIDKPKMQAHTPKPNSNKKSSEMSKSTTHKGKTEKAKSSQKEKEFSGKKENEKEFTHNNYAKEELDPADEFIQESFSHEKLASTAKKSKTRNSSEREFDNYAHNKMAREQEDVPEDPVDEYLRENQE